MKNKIILLTIFSAILVINPRAIMAQYQITSDSLYKHISVLADDSLEGRQVGEPGEWKAAQYIKSIFMDAGLEPLGDSSTYFQSFEFIKMIGMGEKNELSLNGHKLELNEDFSPMRQSASMPFKFDEIINVNYGIVVDSSDGDYDDYAGLDVDGKAVLIKRYSPEPKDSTEEYLNRYGSLTSKISMAIEKNAACILFITPEDQDDTLSNAGPARVTPKDIPIIFLRRTALERLGLDINNPEITSISGITDLYKVYDTGYNVVGYLPAKTDTTVILGAHYDHLGWGGEGSGSRYLENEPMIHNGADDNGSGSSALLELARYYSSYRNELKYSLLFISFSGEEFGILGSGHYARHMTIDSSKVRMMVNMDMIGRLAQQEKGLAIMGTGTCPEFKSYFDSMETGGLTIAFKESGVGPSDHTSFYNQDIPVLYFFTGAHDDYHTPADDVDKIDTEGIVKVTKMVTEIINHFDNYQGELVFQKTKSDDMGRRSSYSVTLGIMPDFITEVEGLGVDGVSPDRPGDRAGLLKGDVIIRMGSVDIGDIYDYMNTLGKYRKGDSTSLLIIRGNDTLNLEVIFE